MDFNKPEDLRQDPEPAETNRKLWLVLILFLTLCLLAVFKAPALINWLLHKYESPVGKPQISKVNKGAKEEAGKLSEELIAQIYAGELPPEEDDQVFDASEYKKVGDICIFVKHPEAELYLSGLLSKLKNQSDPALANKEIKLCLYDDRFLRSKLVGGFSAFRTIYISASVFLSFEDEADLAAMLSHELGHLFLRHSAKSRKISKNITVLMAKFYRQKDLNRQFALSEAMFKIFGTRIIDGRMHMEDELAADRFSQTLMQKIGYDDLAMLKFFVKTKKEVEYFSFGEDRQLNLEKINQRMEAISANHSSAMPAGKLFVYSNKQELVLKQGSFRKHLESLDAQNN